MIPNPYLLREFIESTYETNQGFLRLGVIQKATQEYLGFIPLCKFLGRHLGVYLSYGILKDYLEDYIEPIYGISQGFLRFMDTQGLCRGVPRANSQCKNGLDKAYIRGYLVRLLKELHRGYLKLSHSPYVNPM